MRRTIIFLILCCGLFAQGHADERVQRVVSVGGDVTEIVYALAADSLLVGVDTSSQYPEAATSLPKVGYQRRLSAEGVLSLNPTLVLVSADAGPPAALEQIRQADVRVVVLPDSHSVDVAIKKIRAIASALKKTETGETLAQKLSDDMQQTHQLLAKISPRPRVLFIYARGQGTMLVSGKNTSADAMINLSGGVNAVTEYDGYKPLTSEAVVAAAPDVILMLDSGLESLGDVDDLLKVPGVALTPAGQERRIVTMNGLYLLGFGPRLADAVRDLSHLLHPQLKDGS